MDFAHDVHDWLGGYPYETASAEEITERLTASAFSLTRSFIVRPPLGLFGSGCSEFVFRFLR
jgi:2-polyprenyl-6-hydroxyphenyl methylase/3-demethylubiquinone-9 3-methyltransferase